MRTKSEHSHANALPSDWITSTVGEEFDIKLGKMLDSQKNVGVAKPYLGNRAIQWGRIDVDELPLVPLSQSDLETFRLRQGDLLVCEGGDVGRAAIWTAPIAECYYQKALHRLRPLKGFNVELMAAILRHWSEIGLLNNYVTQTSIAHLPREKFLQIPLPVPPENEQRAIAKALSDIDALIATLDRLIAKKRDIKQATMQQLLTGKTRLPGFSGKWEVKALGELGTISGGGVDKKIKPGEVKVRLVNYMDVYRRNLIRSVELEHVVSAPPDQASRCAVRKGDVFFTPSSEMPYDIAASAVAAEDIPDACYSYHVARLRLHEEWDIPFRAYAFKTQAFLDQAAKTCEGSGVRYVITQGKFRQLTIKYPADRSEQAAIATVLADIDAELTALEARRDKTRALKQGMMQELLTGKTRLI